LVFAKLTLGLPEGMYAAEETQTSGILNILLT